MALVLGSSHVCVPIRLNIGLCVAYGLCYTFIIDVEPLSGSIKIGRRSMVRVTIDTIRVSLVSPQRIVVLREEDGERHVPIWIGPYEAEALTLSLRGTNVQRPLTHDLIKNMIDALGATVSHIIIGDLRHEIFYSSVVLDLNGEVIEVDARPSDAINLAVRSNAAIFVDDNVLEEAGVVPEAGIEETSADEDENLSVFADFLESLDLDLGD